MKKILSFVLLVAMLAGCMFPALVSAAEDSGARISVVSPAEVDAAASTVEVTMKLEGNSEPGIWGMTAVLAYTKGWTVKSVSAAGDLWSGSDEVDDEYSSELSYIAEPVERAYTEAFKQMNISTDDYSASFIHFEKAGMQMVAENGDIAKIVFNKPADAEAGDKLVVKVGSNGDEVSFDENFEVRPDFKVSADTEGVETVLVEKPHAEVATVIGRPGGEVKVDVKIAATPAVNAVRVTDVEYDTSKLTFVGGEWNAEIIDEDLKGLEVVDVVDGALKGAGIVFRAAKEVNTTVLTLTFKVADELEDGLVPVTCKVLPIVKDAEDNEAPMEDYNTMSGGVEVINVLRGDVNGDDKINAADALLLLNHSQFSDEPEFAINQNGDMNGDGKVNSADALLLLNHSQFPDEPEFKLSDFDGVMR